MVVSMVHNEEDLIAPFLDHYFGLAADAIWLLENECTDKTLQHARRYPGVTVTPLASGREQDCALQRDALERSRAACAGRYDWVLLVDADEFLVPRSGSLKDLGSEGYDVVHHPGEPPFDPSAPPLCQRRWGIPNPIYGKPVVMRPTAPVRLGVGLHHLEGPVQYPPLRPFFLLHLAAFDEAIFLKRRRQMTARQGARNIARGYSVQHIGQTEGDLRRRWGEFQTNPALRLLPSRGAPAPSACSGGPA